MAVEKTRLVCFAGAGRSGSTLLARLLGEIDGFVNIGEATAFVTDRRLEARDIPCGCGSNLSDCPFWAPLLPHIDRQTREEAANLMRFRAYPLVMSPSRPSIVDERLRRLARSVAAVMTAVAARTGCRVIVDSTKNPAAAHLLHSVEEIELKVIHLVRDPRGFVSSRFRPKAYLKRIPPLKATAVWLTRNLTAELLPLHGIDYRRLRYEEFVLRPAETVARLGEWIAREPVETDFFDDSTARVSTQHIIGGNPDKLTSGSVRIEPRPWELPGPVQLMVTGLTAPLIHRYGYSVRGIQPGTSGADR